MNECMRSETILHGCGVLDSPGRSLPFSTPSFSISIIDAAYRPLRAVCHPVQTTMRQSRREKELVNMKPPLLRQFALPESERKRDTYIERLKEILVREATHSHKKIPAAMTIWSSGLSVVGAIGARSVSGEVVVHTSSYHA